jgi:hypothetical protein
VQHLVQRQAPDGAEAPERMADRDQGEEADVAGEIEHARGLVLER